MGDSHVRLTHQEVDGTILDIAEPFEVGDSYMFFPRDYSLDADDCEIANCRCSVDYFGLNGEIVEVDDEESEEIIDDIENNDNKENTENKDGSLDPSVLNNYSKEIRQNKQLEHIYGTPAYYNRLKTQNNNHSYFYGFFTIEIVQNLVEKYSGTGYIEGAVGNYKEYVALNDYVGKVYDFASKKYRDVKKFEIKYSPKGTHCFPVKDW